MNRLFVVFAFGLLVCANGQWYPTESDFINWMDKYPSTTITGHETVPQMTTKILERLEIFAKSFLANANYTVHPWGSFQSPQEAKAHSNFMERLSTKHGDKVRRRLNDGFSPFGLKKLPYFGFMPPLQGKLIPGGGWVNWSAPCFKSTSASAEYTSDGDIELVFILSEASSLTCSDSYLFGTTAGLSLELFYFSGTKTVTWKIPKSLSEPDRFDTDTQGVRVFLFGDDPIQTVIDLLDSVNMFLGPMTRKYPSETSAERNAYFIQNYAGFPMKKRGSVQNVDIPESEIQSGDFLGVLRLDGLDPMLAWAMGSTTGHTTVALRFDGILHVCESTAKDSYWPVNGIQCTPWPQWIAQARAAGFNVVHAPLSPENRAKFDEEAALAEFQKMNGTDYGYHNLLWGWLDTVGDNYPCLPPDYTKCLNYDHITVLFGTIDHLIPSVSNLLINPAWNLRLGTTGLNTSQLLQEAAKQGQPWGVLPTIVEQDAWNYPITRHGKPVMSKSMVCCVFVCNMWKAGGLFGDMEFNCAEQTNSNDYQLAIFDTNYTRPQVCQEADPDNNLCQLSGRYQLKLNDYNTITPYAHMGQTCPSKAPTYERPTGC